MIEKYINDIQNLKLVNKPIFNKLELVKYTTDWRGQYEGDTIAILKPEDKFEISKILKFANENLISVVPQGGNTSLCGAATPLKNSHSIVVSTEKMNKIIKIDKNSMSITLEPGVILSKIHEAVEKLDLFFPLSLGAKGSCVMGGNLSTNAGGINVLKYGNTRELCLGLEVILPTGKILNLSNSLKKDNTGYDLKNIFIGAEGTLGIITSATMKLYPKPKMRITSYIETISINNSIRLLNLFQNELYNELEAFELMPRVFWEVAFNNDNNKFLPFDKMPKMGVLVELATTSTVDTIIDNTGSSILHSKLENVLSKALDLGIVEDAIICKNETEKNKFWAIRENAAENEKKELEKSNAKKCLKHDISIPIDKIEIFHQKTQKMIKSKIKNTRTIFFGHLGDGNLHYNIFGNGNGIDGFENQAVKITDSIYKIINELKGSISAEHGVGQLKKNSLKKYKDHNAYQFMKDLKLLVDPNNIMNTGKVID